MRFFIVLLLIISACTGKKKPVDTVSGVDTSTVPVEQPADKTMHEPIDSIPLDKRPIKRDSIPH